MDNKVTHGLACRIMSTSSTAIERAGCSGMEQDVKVALQDIHALAVQIAEGYEDTENARLSERVQELEEELTQAREEDFAEDFNAEYDRRKALQARLAEAKGLISRSYNQLTGLASEPKEALVPRLAAFLHPEQAEKAETIQYMNEVSAEVATRPIEKRGMLDSHATGFEKEKPCNS